jgi:hypothetical protein
MRYKTMYCVVLLSFLFLGITAADCSENTGWEITQYDITVRIPATFDRMEIGVLVELARVSRQADDTLVILIGKNFRGAKVVNVEISDVRNDPVPFTFDDTLLSIELKLLGIDLSRMPYDGSMQLVHIEYELVKDTSFYDEYSPFSFEISDSLCHINAAITRTDNWYPKIAGTMSERLAPYILTIDVPQKFEVMASGRLQDVVVDKGRKVFHWQNYEGMTDRSLYFFAQEQSRMIKEFSDGLKVIMYVPDDARQENIEFLANVVHKSYRFFESAYGKLPWNEYKIMSFAYGYSGLFNSSNAPAALFNSEIVHNDIFFPTRSVVHEVSHTWWGNVVSSNADENYWLYEGFGKYSETAGIKSALGADVESLSFFRLKLCTLPYTDYVPSIKDAQNVDDLVLRTVAAYYMGATYLRMLRYVMGEEKFYNGIKDYVKKNWGKCISSEDFFNAMKKHCRREYHGILTDYVLNPGYARYDIVKLGTIFKDSIYVHNYDIMNVGDKDIVVPYRVNSDMEDYTKDLFVKQGESFLLKVKSRQREAADHVIIDPEEIYPVCQTGLRGPGATLYENQQGEVKAYNIVGDAPFGKAGVTEDMSLLRLNGEELKGKGLRALNLLMLQPEGTVLQMLVKTGVDEPYEVSVKY